MSLSGQSLVRNYKEMAGKPGPSLCLAVGRPPIALLRPVATDARYINKADVQVLTEWRNTYVTSFLTEFKATEQQTTDWLVKMVGPDDTRILFMVDDLNGQTFGYMGLAFMNPEQNYVEADAIVRGGPAPSGTMAACLKALLTWAKEHLGLNNIHVRVRSDNPAVEFYKKLGFTEEKRVSLKKTMEPNKTIWVEDSGTSPVALVYMRLDSSLLA